MANNGEFSSAAKQLADLQKCNGDIRVQIRTLTSLGLVQSAAGSLDHGTATLQKALKIATKELKEMACFVKRRLAYAQVGVDCPERH